MQVDRFPIEGPLLLTPKVFGDDRGFFYESWNQRSFAEALGCSPQEAPLFCQDNHSRSVRGVLRGLHYQLNPRPQSKLVRCVVGEIFDVAVDIRRSSPTYGQWVGACLSDSNHQQFWVPEGFAHGFLTLTETAEVLYKTGGFWSREWERSILWSDPDIGIAWPLQAIGSTAPILAGKDAAAPTLAEAAASGDVFP